jgi:hypothetical protein
MIVAARTYSSIPSLNIFTFTIYGEEVLTAHILKAYRRAKA